MITDWDDAYANRDHVPDALTHIDAWPGDAAAFRDGHPNCQLGTSYGDHDRHKYDLFLPDVPPKGLMIFVHGGYWIQFDRSDWSHFSTGALARGYAVAVIEYPLAPQARIPDITQAVASGISHAAANVAGPIFLVGHSAGGQLVARLATQAGVLDKQVTERIARVTPISGLFDLRPLLRLSMNNDWKMDEKTAMAESPVFYFPLEHVVYTAWVGGAERPEFLRQNALLENIWTGCGARIAAIEEPDRHHFDVINGLRDPDHPLMNAVLG